MLLALVYYSFQLIEDHHNQQRVAVTQQHVTQQQYPLGLSSIKEESHPEPELITVSDDSDSDSDSDISSTSSNSTKEEEGGIHIKNEFEDNIQDSTDLIEIGMIKQINLSTKDDLSTKTMTF